MWHVGCQLLPNLQEGMDNHELIIEIVSPSFESYSEHHNVQNWVFYRGSLGNFTEGIKEVVFNGDCCLYLYILTC